MNLQQWAIRHQISLTALDELREDVLGLSGTPDAVDGMSEEATQSHVRLEGTQVGGRLWRNNVGALLDERGVPVRYGLANDSKRANEVLKSSDLIGVVPRRVTQEMVGTRVGIFTAREMKPGGWVFTGTPREVAQLNFIKLVNTLGGDACFATGRGTL